MKKLFITVICLLLSFGGGGTLYHHITAPITNKNHIVIIPKGSKIKTISSVLKKENCIHHEFLFIISALFSGQWKHLMAGEYFIQAESSYLDIAKKIGRGDVITHLFTVIEGSNVKDVIMQLQANPKLSGVIQTLPSEGMLLPETYAYHYDDDRQKLLSRMQKAMEDLLKKMWQQRSRNSLIKTPNELLALASIVEKETSLISEYDAVASVYLNRLKKGMRLQADPTVVYAFKNLGVMKNRLFIKDLSIDSTYNTYLHTGLPPSPICCPGKNALMAVSRNPQTPYYFFVAKEGGGHYFSASLKEHNGYVQKWRNRGN